MAVAKYPTASPVASTGREWPQTLGTMVLMKRQDINFQILKAKKPAGLAGFFARIFRPMQAEAIFERFFVAELNPLTRHHAFPQANRH
jgi:hypothetical protein